MILIFYKNYMNKYYLTHCETEEEETEITLSLPDYIENQSYGIFASAFYGNQNIKELEIPSTVFEIGKCAFERSNIQTIRIYSTFPPDILPNTFNGVKDNPGFKIEVPQGSLEFYKSSLWIGSDENYPSINIEEGDFGVSFGEKISALVHFDDLGLYEENIGDSIKEIGQMAYLKADNLNTISNDSPIIKVPEGTTDIYTSEEGNSIAVRVKTSIDENARILWPNSLYNYTPNEITLNTPIINQLALQNSTSIEKITIGSKVIDISPFAFLGCTPKEGIWIEDNNKFKVIENVLVKVLNENEYELIYCWDGNSNNINISVWDELKSKIKVVPANFFKDKNFQYDYPNPDNTNIEVELKIPKNIEYIGYSAFQGATGLTTIVFESREEKDKELIIDDYAFYNTTNEISGLPNDKIKLGIYSIGVKDEEVIEENTTN